MPGFDRRGPMGAGPMTGGARGYCNSSSHGIPSAGFGRGMAYGRGFKGGCGPGRGMRQGFGRGMVMQPPVYVQTPADELDMLKHQADSVKTTLESINKRIAELET